MGKAVFPPCCLTWGQTMVEVMKVMVTSFKQCDSMKRQKDRTLKDELPRSVGAEYAIGQEWRNNSRKNEQTEPKQKQCPVVDVTGDGSKV